MTERSGWIGLGNYLLAPKYATQFNAAIVLRCSAPKKWHRIESQKYCNITERRRCSLWEEEWWWWWWWSCQCLPRQVVLIMVIKNHNRDNQIWSLHKERFITHVIWLQKHDFLRFDFLPLWPSARKTFLETNFPLLEHSFWHFSLRALTSSYVKTTHHPSSRLVPFGSI